MDQPPRVYRSLDDNQRALLERLVRECGPRLSAYVRKVHSAADAEEIVAEVFARTAANMSTVASCERPESYLLTIARNLCRDEFRRRRPETVDAQRFDEQAGALCEPHEYLAGSEQFSALRKAVAALAPPFREVVVLRLTANLTFEEIAAMLHVPLGTALSRMHSALQQLRGALAEHCETRPAARALRRGTQARTKNETA